MAGAQEVMQNELQMAYQPLKLWVGSLFHGTFAGQLREWFVEREISCSFIHVVHKGAGQDSFAFADFATVQDRSNACNYEAFK